MKSQNDPEWEQFEKGVAEFVRALDPDANVQHNVIIPDVHTKRPRQRDVWIEAKLCKHFPVNIYLSCKLWKRRINQQDIDAFNGELISSGAHKGVIYSSAGYTKPALEKAAQLGICCCKLFINDKPDLPINLIFYSYCCTARILVKVLENPDPGWNVSSYHELFNIEVEGEGKTVSVLDLIDTMYKDGEQCSVESRDKTNIPSAWHGELIISETESNRRPLRILVAGSWNIYRGKLEATLLNGSYSFLTEEFIGSQSTPWIDTKGPHPGPGWELLEKHPASLEPSYVITVLYGGDVKDVLVKNLGHKSIKIVN